MPIPYYHSTLLEFIAFTAIYPTHVVVTYYVDENLYILPLAVGCDLDNLSFLRRAIIVWHPTITVYELWVPNQHRA